jgi:uncharacterized membrane protein
MGVLSPGLAELLLLGVASAAACMVRPWRLLGPGSRYALWHPLVLALLASSVLWWWRPSEFSSLQALVGAQLVLLVLGWPLAVLAFVACGAVGVALGADPLAAATTAFWSGVLPATLGLALGHGLRRLIGTHVFGYLLGRAWLVPLACTWSCAMLSHAWLGRHGWLQAEAGPALLLVAVLDAMLTGTVATLLVATCPRCLATWSDALYLDDARPSPRAVAVRD